MQSEIDFDNTSDKRRLYDHLRTLNGVHRVEVSKVGSRHLNRYKYVFAHVYATILNTGIYTRMDGNALTTEELHQYFKLTYNPVLFVNAETGETIKVPGMTRVKDDKDFFENYLERIMADHAEAPFFCEFMDWREWGESRNRQV